MNKDIYDRFQDDFEKPATDPAQPADHMEVAEARAMEDDLAAAVDPLVLPDFDQQTRDTAAGKRFPEEADILLQTGDGIDRTDVGKEIDVSSQVYRDAAHQDLAIGPFLMAILAIVTGADTSLLCAAGEAEALMKQCNDRLDAAQKDPSLDGGTRDALRSAFGDAKRLLGEAQREAAGGPAPLSPEAIALQQKQEAEKSKQRVARFLDDVASGKVSFLTEPPSPSQGASG